jgi:hypothetical protein
MQVDPFISLSVPRRETAGVLITLCLYNAHQRVAADEERNCLPTQVSTTDSSLSSDNHLHYHIAPHLRAKKDKQIQELAKDGIAEPPNIEEDSVLHPLFLIKKPTVEGVKWRVILDA